MKALLVAVGVLALGATAASAQIRPGQPPSVFRPAPPPPPPVFQKEIHPYPMRVHNVCQEKAHRLHEYEKHAAADGRIDRRERETIRLLQRDLDRTCRRYRFHG